MYRLILTGLATTLLAAQPAFAQEIDYDAYGADYDEVSAAFETGLELVEEDRVAAAASFVTMATKAEEMLAAYPTLEQRELANLHYSAGNGWYYAGDNYHELARGESDPALYEKYHAAMLDALLTALSHQSPLYAGEEQPFNPAEYYFTARLLAHYGIEHDDPRKLEWAGEEVKAARERLQQTEILEFMEPWPATAELIRALVQYAEQSGDESSMAEARALFANFPEDHWKRDEVAELLG